MRQYLSKMVFQIVHSNVPKNNQFDEQWRVLSADNVDAAFIKAKNIGLDAEETLVNVDKQTVKWTFVGVSELFELPELSDGVELFSRIEETENAHSYRSKVLYHQEAIVSGKLNKPRAL